jgi:autotransporter passenger strand-loop-strand repeat protein
MTTYTAPPNQTNLVLNKGDTLDVNSGGNATGTTINGGLEKVLAGGLDAGATIHHGGAQDVFGVAFGATIDSRGLQVVEHGGTASHTTINDGSLHIRGFAVDTTINNGGGEIVSVVGVTENVTFGGDHALLAIAANPSHLIGDVTNWRVGDIIDFRTTTVTSAHETGNVLTVTYGDQSASYRLVGQQPNTKVEIQKDSFSGTELVLTPLVGAQHHHHDAGHHMIA